MILGVTGHRPDKLGGYGPPVRNLLVECCIFALDSYKPDRVITGMALGFDMAVANACTILKIPYVAAVPFEGQESRWPMQSQSEWRSLIAQAQQVVYVCEPGYDNKKMQIRNEWIVDNCTHLMSLHDGSPGGTNNCVKYAKKVGRPTVNIWETWESFRNA